MSLQQIGIALDQLANAILGGSADETISARAYRLGYLRGDTNDSKHWRFWVRVLDFAFGRLHCFTSFAREKARYNEPREYQ